MDTAMPTQNSNSESENQLTTEMNKVDTADYELQLTQLQDQLIATMIENENMKAELVKFKEKNHVDELMRDLQFERDKNTQLCTQLRQQVEKVTQLVKANLDVAQEATEDLLLVSGSEKESSRVSIPTSRWNKVQNYFVNIYHELIEDLTSEPEVDKGRDPDGDPLTVKQLKDNIKRFKHGVGPMFYLCQSFYNVFTWKFPLFTFVTFVVYMYSVWCGWLLPLLLFLCIVRLAVNCLKVRGWNIDVRFLPNDSTISDEEVVSADRTALTDKFNLVLQVARQVQNILGELADGLEKLKNLLLWRHEEASQQLFIVLCVAFLLSCVMSGIALFRLVALYMGVKMFLIEYIYSRFPRFKQRHDSVYRTWNQLPTDAVLDNNFKRSLIDRHIIIVRNDESGDNNGTNELETELETTDDVRSFCEVFGLPLSERPLPDWETGWRVSIVDRDKPFLKAFSRNGRLYLTNSFLCVERYKFQSPKNILLPLTDITHIEKAKAFAWLPGAGMSIQISATGYEQPYILGAIMNRDDCFHRLVCHGVRLELPWALEHSTTDIAGSAGSGVGSSSESRDNSPSSSPSAVSTGQSFRMSELRASIDDDSLVMMCS